MALQFIFGSSGSGKSNYIYEQILEMSEKEPSQFFFVIVPEQFTMQTQRELVSRQKNNGIMNIDVVSFQRLAYRIFDELGLADIKVLEETGKNFVLRKVAENKKEELRILKGNIKKPGYMNEMKSMISELMQYRISAEQLGTLSEEETLPAPFRYRMQDIQVIYQGFLDYLQGNYITAEELLEVLASSVKHSELLRNSILVVDGFTGFTPVQYVLLEELLRYVKDIYVTVTIDHREDPYHCQGMHELFYMSKTTIQRLSELAEAQKKEIKVAAVFTHDAQTRFQNSKQLEWLEQNLFRNAPGRYHEEESDIRLYRLSNPRQELLFVASEIKRLVREEGYRYRDIAMVCGDVEMYGNYVPEIFHDYDIPYFLDKKENISFHPFTEMIKRLLEVIETDFSHERVMAYLRCGLSGIAREDIDLLENYLLANRIRGFQQWKKKWVRLAGVTGAEELELVNTVRAAVLEPFEVLHPVFTQKETSVREKTIALYQFICGLQIQEMLEKRRVDLEEQGRFALAKEYAQIYKLVMDLLNKFAQLLSDEKMSVREYRQILEAGFEASSVGIIPPGYDQVLIGDIERTRLPDIKVLFFAGVNDGLIPKAEQQGGLISQQEREVFARHSMELAPGVRERAFIQKFYLYLNLTKPSERLYLTWFRTNTEGKEARKSYLTGMICKIFPKLKPTKVEEIETLSQLVSEKSSKRILVEGIRKARDGEVSPFFLSLLSWYRKKPELHKQAEAFLESAFHVYERTYLSSEVAKALYGKVLENSVSRLERFASCAYAHFMSYGIGLKERQLGEFAPVDIGTIFHGALERYSVKMEEQGYTWFDISKEEQERLLTEALEDTVEEVGELLYQDARTSYMKKRLLRILRKTVETITGQIVQSNFAPEGYEISFSFVQDMKAVNFTLSEEEKMRLKGRIDRVDAKKEGDHVYVKVVDYKSGNTQFSLISLYHGLQLQLVVYLNAALEMMKTKYPDKKVEPAGMFYYHIDDPIIDAKGSITEEEIREKVEEQLKLNGVGIETGDVSISKKSQQVSAEELKVMSEFVNTKIKNLGKAIYRGEVQANPYRMKDESGCDYCPYHGVCGFDRKMPGYEYRRLEEIKDKEVLLEKMKKENADGNEIYRGATEGN